MCHLNKSIGKTCDFLKCTFNHCGIFSDCPLVPVAVADHNRSHDGPIMTTERNITLPVTK